MKCLNSLTFAHEQFRREKLQVYTDDEITAFYNNFRKQLRFNFLATWISQKQLVCSAAAWATRLCEVDLDLIPKESKITTNRNELSCYILEDLLDCPVGSQFILCIATDNANFELGDYYSDKALTIAKEICQVKRDCEYWKMDGRRYFVQQAYSDRLSQYSYIKMKALLRHQFIDAFNNEGGDFVLRFDGTTTWLTIPWSNIIHTSKSVMVFGVSFLHGRLFAELFGKMKIQHAHHILWQFASVYYGDSKMCFMLFIEYHQAQLDVATSELKMATHDFTTRGLVEDVSFLNELTHLFQRWFDNYCKHAFINCMNGYNDYSQPLIFKQDFLNFLLVSKWIFPLQWEFLFVRWGHQSMWSRQSCWV